MFKKTISYTDYNGNARTEDFYFNLNRVEVAELDSAYPGGIEAYLKASLNPVNPKAIMDMFKNLISSAYGEKSPDGRRFVKSEEISNGFMQTEAYDELYMEICMNPDKAAEFFNGIVKSAVDKSAHLSLV